MSSLERSIILVIIEGGWIKTPRGHGGHHGKKAKKRRRLLPNTP